MKAKAKRPRKIRIGYLSAGIRPGVGASQAELTQTRSPWFLYPSEARKLAAWLLQFAEWGEEADRETV